MITVPLLREFLLSPGERDAFIGYFIFDGD
jgi:hypothetical protein